MRYLVLWSAADASIKERRTAIQYEPEQFHLEQTTVWAFPERGDWATHTGSYRGNWTPYVPRNLILRYSVEGDWILDPFLGSGTTLIEAKLLGRNAVGVDINPEAVQLAGHNLSFEPEKGPGTSSNICIRTGNAARLDFLKDNSMDLICAHPPYADIIRYSSNQEGDLSLLPYETFLDAMGEVAKELHRVEKTGGICAVMIGDIRRQGNVRPLGMNTLMRFLDAGFRLKEIVIKEQHNCRSADYWERRPHSFLLLAHEYIFIMEKTARPNRT